MTGAMARAPSAPDKDDNVDMEHEVIMGHLGLGPPGQVSVLEAVDMTLLH
jgi:hypothetical protein